MSSVHIFNGTVSLFHPIDSGYHISVFFPWRQRVQRGQRNSHSRNRHKLCIEQQHDQSSRCVVENTELVCREDRVRSKRLLANNKSTSFFLRQLINPRLDVDNLSAELNLQASVASLVTLNAGVQVGIQKVNITISDIEAELELIIRLGNCES